MFYQVKGMGVLINLIVFVFSITGLVTNASLFVFLCGFHMYYRCIDMISFLLRFYSFLMIYHLILGFVTVFYIFSKRFKLLLIGVLFVFLKLFLIVLLKYVKGIEIQKRLKINKYAKKSKGFSEKH